VGFADPSLKHEIHLHPASFIEVVNVAVPALNNNHIVINIVAYFLVFGMHNFVQLPFAQTKNIGHKS
jgi:hypothetical protein